MGTPDAELIQSKGPRELFPIVGIGASAGGLEAFTRLLEALPQDTGMGFVLVQHLDPDHESQLTQILARSTPLPVCQIEEGQAVERNRIYVIPRDFDLTISGGVLKLQPRQRTPFRPINVFFESLAQDRRELAVGVVLSGTASDGTLGLEAIKAEGGITFAQDGSAKYDSMPKSAVAAGCVDLVLSPAAIAQELARIAKHPYVEGRGLIPGDGSGERARASATAHQGDLTALPSGGRGTPRTGAEQARAEAELQGQGGDDAYKQILLLLRNHSGVDFSLYKSNTIQRRISRRLVLCRAPSLEAYASLLRGDPQELNALYSDVLISVTSFFRNPETFEVIEQKVMPDLIKRRGDKPLRVWVLGCSTGQEAYSIAMVFAEVAEKAPRLPKLQIFATDLNDALLEKARHGLYAKSLVEDISPQRLRRFFVEEDGGYRVSKALRETVVFARQNVIADPPFSRLDLISCRNLLIYLEPGLQRKAIPTFHYALNPEGYLVLGASESISGFTELFEPVDKKHKIYSKKQAHTPAVHLPARRGHGEEPRPLLPKQERGAPARPEDSRGELNAQREADRITVTQFAPPAVLINADLQVIQFRGPTGAFLEPPLGKASFDVLKMAREGLMLPLRSVISQARKSNKTTRKENVAVKRNGKTRKVNLEVIPLRNLQEDCFLVVFEEANLAKADREPLPPQRRASEGEAQRRVAELEAELAEMREYLQSLQEQHEAANEEVQSANEEVQSANEELQSVNEELETSKEELESANEELTTVNEEMSNRNVELNRVNSDLVNLQASAKLVVVLFGRDLTIRRFSPQAEKEFDLLLADLGRPLSALRHGLVEVRETGRASAAQRAPLDLEGVVATVIADVREQEREVLDRDGRWRSLRVRPYMTLDNKVDGAVLILLDIDALKRSEQAMTLARDYAESTIDTVREPLLVLDEAMHVESASRSFYRVFRVAPAEIIGRSIYELGNRHWDTPVLHELLDAVATRSTPVEDFEIEQDFEHLGRRAMLLNARRIQDPRRESLRILVAISDVTDKKAAEGALSMLAAIVASSDDAIVGMTLDGIITSWNRGAEKLYGYTVAEALGQHVSMFIPRERRAEEAEALARLRRGEDVEHFETERQTKDGRRVSVSLRLSPIRDATGQVIGASKMARDITWEKAARQELIASEERLRFTLEATQVGQWDLDLVTDRAKRSLRHDQIFGYTALLPEWGFETFLKHVHPEDRASVVQSFKRALAEGKVWDIDCRVIRVDLSERWISAKGTVYRSVDGRPLRMSGLVMDITERKRTEGALRQSAVELSVADRRKNEFLAMLGHELRNPLSALSLGLELVDRAPAGSTRTHELHAMMGRQAKHMGVLLEQLLDIARVIAGKIELSRSSVDLTDVVRGAAEMVRPLVESKRHDLRLTLPNEPVFVWGDPNRLTQVVENLLTNAAKYTEDGGQISLTIDAAETEVRIIIRDSGTGMSAELLPHIFEVFTQEPRTLDRSKGGLGLGLSLVRRLVEMHGGDVRASSPGVGLGSEFVVTLPRSREGRRADDAGASARARFGQVPSRRVLVVDDQGDAGETLACLLEAEGHKAMAVDSGAAALAAFDSFEPEVVLLDLGMPEMDGYEVARRLRAEHADKKVLLIAITGYQSDEARLKQAGFDQHLIKPPDTAKLSTWLRAYDPT